MFAVQGLDTEHYEFIRYLTNSVCNGVCIKHVCETHLRLKLSQV